MPCSIQLRAPLLFQWHISHSIFHLFTEQLMTCWKFPFQYTRWTHPSYTRAYNGVSKSSLLNSELIKQISVNQNTFSWPLMAIVIYSKLFLATSDGIKVFNNVGGWGLFLLNASCSNAASDGGSGCIFWSQSGLFNRPHLSSQPVYREFLQSHKTPAGVVPGSYNVSYLLSKYHFTCSDVKGTVCHNKRFVSWWRDGSKWT